MAFRRVSVIVFVGMSFDHLQAGFKRLRAAAVQRDFHSVALEIIDNFSLYDNFSGFVAGVAVDFAAGVEQAARASAIDAIIRWKTDLTVVFFSVAMGLLITWFVVCRPG